MDTVYKDMTPGRLWHGCVLSMLSALCFGSLPIFGKLAQQAGVHTMDLILFRFWAGALFLGLYLLWRNPALLRPSRSLLLKAAGIGCVIYCAQSFCFFTALETLPATTTTLCLYAYPITVTILSVCFLGMRFNRTTLFSLLLAGAGTCLVLYDAFARSMDPVGLAWAVAAPLFFSTYLVLIQVVLRKEPPLKATFYILVFTGISFSILRSPAHLLDMTATQAGWCTALAFVGTTLSVSLLFLAIERVGSAYASLFSSVEPVAALVLAAWILDEKVILLQVGGTLLILLGIVLPNLHALAVKKRVANALASQ